VTAPLILAIRHGATELSASGFFVGRSDPPLSEHGKAQAAAWRSLADSDLVTRVVASPLARAGQTADIAGFASVETDPNLIEWDLGDLEGQHAEQWRAAHPDWSLFVDGPPESGERYPDVAARARRAVANVEGDSGLVVFVGHGQMLKVLAAELLGLASAAAAAFALGPARGGLFLHRTAGWRLAGWNLPAPHTAASLLMELT
jgi:probable phosphoglycerate mutase